MDAFKQTPRQENIPRKREQMLRLGASRFRCSLDAVPPAVLRQHGQPQPCVEVLQDVECAEE